MLRIISLSVLLVFAAAVAEYGAPEPRKKTDSDLSSEAVKRRHEDDLRRIDEIKKKMDKFFQDINSQLKRGRGKDFTAPVDLEKIEDIEDIEDIDHSHGQFDRPVSGKITDRYGYRVDPKSKQEAFHKGLDIAAPAGTSVRASAGGVVRKAGFLKNGYGNLVIIEHEKELSTYYGHLSKIEVREGQKVERGDIIGKVGSTGKATGPHLHFEVRKGKMALNPEEYLR